MTESAERIYERARDLPAETRAAFLREACAEDAELRQELQSLLAEADAAEAFFEALSGVLRPSTPPDDATSTLGERPASEDLPPGHVIGRYRIIERAGGGGMGTVYRARDTRLDRDVALKFLSLPRGAGAVAEQRLLVEARSAAALQHPNICTIYEVGETEDAQPFIAMAYYEGETLEARLRHGPLPVEEAVGLAHAVTRGLAAAHLRGIVHRDIKPGNVMLTSSGEVRILDFGLAETIDALAVSPALARGTVAYMSPEQLRGEVLDGRTDLWSLGVMLHEMVTGARPFAGADGRQVVEAILSDTPAPVGGMPPGAPEAVSRIVARLLQKDPGERYPGAPELLADLSDVEGALASGTPRRRRSPAVPPLAAAGLALLALSAILFRPHPGRREGGAVADAPDAPPPRIAVLPLTADTDEVGLLAGGLTEELITALGRTGRLRVVASASVLPLVERGLDLPAIAESLGVSHVLGGGVERLGSRMRFRLRLVDARDGSTEWSETYDRALDISDTQDDVARGVARELGVRLAPRREPGWRGRPAPPIAAYELFLRGGDQTLLRSRDGVRAGIGYFEQAIAIDTTYAEAYGGLARMLLVLSEQGIPADSAVMLRSRAEQAALHAISLDDSVAEAHASVGLLRGFVQLDHLAAEAELERAIALDPTRALPRQWLAQLYIRMDRPAEALAEARLALDIDPLSSSAHAELAHALLANGRYDEALEHLGVIAGVQPPLRRAPFYSAQAYVAKRMWPEALEAAQPDGRDRDPRAVSLYAWALARAGHREEALRLRDSLIERSRTEGFGAFPVVAVAAGLGDFDAAFEWLERAAADGSALRNIFNVAEPAFEDLRADPRFEPIRTRLRLQKR